MGSDCHEPRYRTPTVTGLQTYWGSLTRPERRKLLHIPRKTLFEAIRTRYCSRCFGLFSLRYDELRYSNTPLDQAENGCSSCAACPACQDFFLGLKADGKGITLDDRLLEGDPFGMFKQSKVRERERDIQFMTAGDVCGSGFNPKRSGKVCALHTTCVSPETLLAYWDQLPAEHRTALLTLPRHDFEAELESCCSLQLRICKDCRFSVVGQYKIALAAGRKTTAATAAAAAKDAASKETFADYGEGAVGHEHCSENCCSHLGSSLTLDALDADVCDCCTTSCAAVEAMGRHLVNVCDGFWLSVTDTSVQLIGSDAAALLEEAEEIEDLKASETGDDDSAPVRHAETPELAREALVDAVILIFKAQVEVAFREQTAGHNALLLLVALAHELLEERLCNAALDVRARAAETELLELVEDERRNATRPSRSQRRRAKHALNPTLQPPAAASVLPDEPSVAPPDSHVAAAAADTAVTLLGADKEPCSLGADIDEPHSFAINAADACSSLDGAVSCSASWDFGRGDDDTDEKGEWEIKQRGRRSSGRRPAPEPTAHQSPARQQRKPSCTAPPAMHQLTQSTLHRAEAPKGSPNLKAQPYLCVPPSSQWPTIADAATAASLQQNQNQNQRQEQQRQRNHHHQQHQHQHQQQEHVLSAAIASVQMPSQHFGGWPRATLPKAPLMSPPTHMQSLNCSAFSGYPPSSVAGCATPTFTHTSCDATSGSGRSSTEYNLWGGYGEDQNLRSMPHYCCPIPIASSVSRESALATYEALLPATMSPRRAPPAPPGVAAVTTPSASGFCRPLPPPPPEEPPTAAGVLGSNAAWSSVMHRRPTLIGSPPIAAAWLPSQDPRGSDAGFSLFSNFPAVGPPPAPVARDEGGKGGTTTGWASFGPKGTPNLHHCLPRNADSIRAF